MFELESATRPRSGRAAKGEWQRSRKRSASSSREDPSPVSSAGRKGFEVFIHAVYGLMLVPFFGAVEARWRARDELRCRRSADFTKCLQRWAVLGSNQRPWD